MKWLFLNSGSYSGKFNMQTDLFLADNCEPDEAVFRLYRWEPYCISLGANQEENIINKFEARKNNIDLVRRPTGGRAILHAEEITYSVIYPITINFSAKKLYSDINFALKKGLKNFSTKLEEVELESSQPDFPRLYKNISGSVCFAASAKSELKYNGKKLAGSAQRKFKKAVLQHGSILCGSFHTNIIDYLNVDETEKEKLRIELNDKTTDLNSILHDQIDYGFLSESIIAGFKEYFNIITLQYA